MGSHQPSFLLFNPNFYKETMKNNLRLVIIDLFQKVLKM